MVGLDVLRPEQFHGLANAGLADVDAALRDLHGGALREQLDEIVPLLLVEIVAVRRYQVLDRIDVFEPLDARRERRDRAFELGDLRIDGLILGRDAQRRQCGGGERGRAEDGELVRLAHCAPPLPGFSKCGFGM
jgi:hypothetical protein